MNTDTGHLVIEEELLNMTPGQLECYEEVPEHLNLSAQLELAGRNEAYVGKEATSKIATWARSKRNRLKLKIKKRRANKLCCR